MDMADLPDLDIDSMDVDAADYDADDDTQDYELDMHGDDFLFEQQDLTGHNFLHSVIPKEQAYDLRPGDRFQPADEYGAYIDDDATGNYDPNAKIFRPRRAGARTEIERTEDEEAMRAANREVTARAVRLEHRAAKINDASLIVTFLTDNDDMRKLVEKIADNWAPELNAEEVITTRFRRAQPVSDDSPSGNQPRIEDPFGREFDLAHHPAARGCAGCRKLGEDCSLLNAESDHTWPCILCAQDGVFCELLVPPTLKKSCEACNQKKQKCSYVHDLSYDHSVPCVRCLESGHNCEAGPAEGGIRERISYDKDYANIGKPVRKYKHCTACRKGKHPCSLKTVDDPPPCDRCRELGLNCVFWRVVGGGVPKAESEKRKQANKKKREMNNHLIEAKKTALIHPIKFLDGNSKLCSFCVKPNYGIIGLTSKFHEKFLAPTDSSHKEFKEIQTSSNPAARTQCSRMCNDCTMSRLQVVVCPGHEIIEIPGLMKTTIDLEGGGTTCEPQFDMVMMYSQMLNNRMREDDAWCSLCVAPALYACCAFQEADKWGQPNQLGDTKADGCGLKLCDSCYDEYYKKDCDLSKVLASIRKIRDGMGTKRRWLWGPRADAGFLLDDGVFEDGLLFRNFAVQE